MISEGIIRDLHKEGKPSLDSLIANTGLSDIHMVEFGAYAGEGTRIFAENPNVQEIWAVSTYEPWDDPRCRMSKSNFPAAEEELDALIAEYPDKIHKFKGTLADFYRAHPDYHPDLVYIDERLDIPGDSIDVAIRMGAKFISGHDYNSSTWPEVRNFVTSTLHGPDIVFDDTSWLKKLSNVPACDIALCVIGRRENLYAREFVEHYKGLGFSHIYVYDNNRSGEEYFEDVLSDYIEDGYVTVIDYRDKTRAQADAYNDCILRFRRKHTWIAFFDFDEYLAINNGKTILEILEDYRKFDCVLVNWMMFTDSNLIHYDNRPLVERFTETIPREKIGNVHNFDWGPKNKIHSKPIVKCNIPDLMFLAEQVHLPVRPRLRVCNANGVLENCDDGHDITIPAYDTMQLNHYSTKTLEEWLNRKVNVGGGICYKNTYKNYFFGINKRTLEKELFIFQWLKDHPEIEDLSMFERNYKIWVSYHSDYLVWKHDLKFDSTHILFPTHKDVPLDNVYHMCGVWCELATLWYVYHNRLKSNFVGFSHYRRHMHPSRLPNPGECACYAIYNNFGSIYDQYLECHRNVADIDVAVEFLDDKYGKDNKYTEYIKKGRLFLPCNCFVMTWDDFIALCDFLFPIIEYVSEKLGCGMDESKWRERAKMKFSNDGEEMITVQTRAVGFLAERLVSAYIATNMKFYS